MKVGCFVKKYLGITLENLFCRENICHIVKAPACVSWEIKNLATDVAYKAVSSLEGAGIFAVELFLTEDGQVVSSMFTTCKIEEIVWG